MSAFQMSRLVTLTSQSRIPTRHYPFGKHATIVGLEDPGRGIWKTPDTISSFTGLPTWPSDPKKRGMEIEFVKMWRLAEKGEVRKAFSLTSDISYALLIIRSVRRNAPCPWFLTPRPQPKRLMETDGLQTAKVKCMREQDLTSCVQCIKRSVECTDKSFDRKLHAQRK